MRAFELAEIRGSKAPEVDCGYNHCMPDIKCNICHRTAGYWSIEYPAINFEFVAASGLYCDRKVTLEEFRVLQERIFEAASRRFLLVAGGKLGTPSGKASSSKLEDFAWAIVNPLISKRAVELLDREGIRLRTGKVDLVFRGKRLESHVSLQIEPYPVLTEENKRAFTLEHCPVCDDYHQVELKPKVPQGMQIDRSKIPDDHLFTSIERSGVIASNQFIEATRKHGLTGVDFVDCGEYV